MKNRQASAFYIESIGVDDGVIFASEGGLEPNNNDPGCCYKGRWSNTLERVYSVKFSERMGGFHRNLLTDLSQVGLISFPSSRSFERLLLTKVENGGTRRAS